MEVHLYCLAYLSATACSVNGIQHHFVVIYDSILSPVTLVSGAAAENTYNMVY